MNDHTEDDFDGVDREAPIRALQLTVAGNDKDRAEQVRSMLAEDDW